MKSFIMNSHEVFIHIHQGCFAGTGAIVRLPQCQRSKPDGYGKISQCITTTKHSKAKTVCIFLGIYCTWIEINLALISNDIPSKCQCKMWDPLTDLFPNSEGCTVEVWEWISNFIPHFIMELITYPCGDLTKSMLEGGPILGCVDGSLGREVLNALGPVSI